VSAIFPDTLNQAHAGPTPATRSPTRWSLASGRTRPV